MISVDRAKAILQCYGGQSQAWPEKERRVLQQAISGSKVLQSLQQEALALDEFMAFTNDKEVLLDNKTVHHCINQVLDNLPEQELSTDQRLIANNNIVYRLGKHFLDNSFSTILIASILLIIVNLTGNLQYSNLKQKDALTLSDYMELYVDDNNTQNNDDYNDMEELEILAFLEPDLVEEDG